MTSKRLAKAHDGDAPTPVTGTTTPAATSCERLHTPGPWEAGERVAHLVVCGAASECVAVIPHPAFDGHGVTDREERRANVRLLAAAPRMLAALERMERRYVELIESGDCGFWNADEDEDVLSMRAAIALATS